MSNFYDGYMVNSSNTPAVRAFIASSTLEIKTGLKKTDVKTCVNKPGKIYIHVSK